MSDALITKYRPKTFVEVIGQEGVVRSLQAALKSGTSKTFLFSGDSGLGKTTLARLAAVASGCAEKDIVGVDGVSQSSKEEMLAVTSTLMYRPIGAGKTKAVIVDEAQGLSKAAIVSLLAVLEEPPEHVYWFLCTTEPTRIPQAIKTRSTHFSLKPVLFGALAEMLDRVVEAEKFSTSQEIVDLCAAEAGGSPRQALSNLSACAVAKDLKEAKDLLRSALESEEAVNLARGLLNGMSWVEAQRILGGLSETNPESIRHVVRSYVTKVALSAKKEPTAGRALEILDAFSTPFYSADGLSPVVLATGKVLLQ